MPDLANLPTRESSRMRPLARLALTASKRLRRPHGRLLKPPTRNIMIWYVAAGSAVGGMIRFLLGTFIQQRSDTTFPVGTLLVNVTGSLLLGFLLQYSDHTPAITPQLRAMLTIGLCGGYTTFSAFSYETVVLLEDGNYKRAALYVLLSVAVSIVGVFIGLAAGRALTDARAGA